MGYEKCTKHVLGQHVAFYHLPTANPKEDMD